MEYVTLDQNDKRIEKGKIGEQLIVDNIISNIDIYSKIIRNVILVKDNKETEVDIILITIAGIFVIESKNFQGYIYGDIKDKYWTQVLTRDNHNMFDNPIMQNQYHIDFISNNLKLDKSYFHSYIVFGDNSKIQKVTVNNDISNVKVINNKDLIENLIYDIHIKDIILSVEEIDKIYIDLKYFYSHLN